MIGGPVPGGGVASVRVSTRVRREGPGMSQASRLARRLDRQPDHSMAPSLTCFCHHHCSRPAGWKALSPRWRPATPSPTWRS